MLIYEIDNAKLMLVIAILSFSKIFLIHLVYCNKDISMNRVDLFLISIIFVVNKYNILIIFNIYSMLK